MTFSEFQSSELCQSNHYLVIGNPIHHSRSPLMHNLALKTNSIDADYHAVQLLEQEKASFIAHLNKPEFKGCNITIPYKRAFLDAVDEITIATTEIGAINTIYKEGDKLVGTNTDAYGFIQPLKHHEDDLNGEKAIIFGTGGAADAVLYGLEQLKMEEIVMVSRTPKTSGYKGYSVIGYDEWMDHAEESMLIVNTTPMGMSLDEGKSVVQDAYMDSLSGKICYDLIYNPIKTRFLEQAEEVESEIINGIDMFIHQGAESFRIWTGKEFPIDTIRELLEESLNAA